VNRPARVFLALGSNLGDRGRHLDEAVRALRASPGVGQVEISPVYETAPVGPPQGRYLNAVASLTTTLPARALLDRLRAIERAAGRRRGSERNAPRTLDLDILFYGDECIDEDGLQVPHPRLQERAFVLTPLADLAPSLVHPRLGLSVAMLLDRVRDPDAVRSYAPEPVSNAPVSGAG
jgi:2-amino-4-hydroxy-6-hydroxymethyldihydropteridine diphosphokinase